MQTKIQKWGNSLGIRIPKDLADRIGLGQGVSVNMKISDSNLIISLQVSELDLMLNRVTFDNLHNEVLDDGSALGNESW